MCNDEVIDETRLFSGNQLALICIKLKFCMGRLWSEVYSMSTYVKVLPAAPVIIMMWWSVQWHSVSQTIVETQLGEVTYLKPATHLSRTVAKN